MWRQRPLELYGDDRLLNGVLARKWKVFSHDYTDEQIRQTTTESVACNNPICKTPCP